MPFKRISAFALGLFATVAAVGAIALGNTPSAQAHHRSITETDYYFSPNPNVGDHPFNGYKVFLSSPRHRDSGARGECLSQGREENLNGRYFNLKAAEGDYYFERADSVNPGRNLRARGYKVLVGRNTRDNGYLASRTKAENWGANVYIATHSNADPRGCGSRTNYGLVMHRDSGGTQQERYDSLKLATSIAARFDDPGIHPSGVFRNAGARSFVRFTPAELKADVSDGAAYVEIAFHTSRAGNEWLDPTGKAKTSAWRYGYAVDVALGYP